MSKRYFIVFFMLVLFSISIYPIFAIERSIRIKDIPKDPVSQDFVPNELIIKYKDKSYSKDLKTLEKNLTQKGLKVKSRIDKNRLTLAEVNEEKTIESVINALKKDSDIESVQKNYLYKISSIDTNDPYIDDLWGLHNTGQTIGGITGTEDADIDAPEAWERYSGNGTIVAVLDTGVDYTHPELANMMWDGSNCRDWDNNYLGGCVHGYDFIMGDKIPLPTTSNHGTMVASIIAAERNNETGILGIVPNAKIMALKIDIGNSYGNAEWSDMVTTFSVISAIEFAKYNGAKIINASFGGGADEDDSLDLLLKSYIDGFNGLFITAAGNEGINNDSTPTYPCSFNSPNIICVAATDSDDNLTEWSNYGSTSVDIGAPGDNLVVPRTISNSETEFSEDFDTTTVSEIPAGWSRSSGSNYFGVDNIGEGNGALFVDYSHIPYLANANTYVTSPAIDLSSTTGAQISFITACDTEYSLTGWYDYMALEVSKDNNTYELWQRWDEAFFDDDDNPYNHGIFTVGYYLMEIPDAYRTSSFRFRLRWVTDSTDSGDGNGCLVDDILIEKYTSSLGYSYASGTSFSTPYTAGVAALVWAQRPDLTTQQVKTAILESGDSISSLSGKTLTGKRLNANNALLSVDTIKSFKFTVGGVDYPCSLNRQLRTVSCNLPGDIGRSNLTPTISLTAGSIEPASGVANNFWENSTYVYSKDESLEENWTVNFSNYFRTSLNFRSGVGNWGVSNTKYTVTGDFNGDGKDEIAAMYDYGYEDMAIIVFSQSGNSLTNSTWFRSGVGNWGVPYTKHVVAGDFNGDGKDEIAAMYDYGYEDMAIIVFSASGNSFTTSTWFRSGLWNWGVPYTKYLVTGDFNGDGKDQIAAMYDYGREDMGMIVFSASGNSFTTSTWFRSGLWNWGVPYTKHLVAGDFNGSGKDQIAAMYDYGREDMGMIVFLPNNNSFTTSTWFRSGLWNWGVPYTKYLTAGDFNEDGKDQIAAMYDYGREDMGMIVFSSNNNSFTTSTWFRSGLWNWGVPYTKHVAAGDFNGNGIDEISSFYDYGREDMGIIIFK